MNRWHLTLSVLLAASFLAFPFTLAAQGQNSVRVRVTNWQPAYWQENGEWVGMDLEFYRAIEKATDLSFTYVDLPWSRSITSLKNGTCILMSQLSKTPERQQFIHFLGPYNHEEIVLVVHKEDRKLKIDNLDDLAGWVEKRRRKVAIERDAWYGKAFKYKMDSDPGFKNHFVYTHSRVVKMMELRRLLGFFEQRIIISHKIRNLPEFSQLAIHDFRINSEDIFFGVSKKARPDVVDKLRRAVRELSADGTFKRIESKWKQY